MEPDTNLYSPNENNEIIRENSQKKLYVLPAKSPHHVLRHNEPVSNMLWTPKQAF